jgi:hypothetical protein
VIAPGIKTEGSAATIVLDPFVVTVLRTWRERQQGGASILAGAA